AFRRSKGDSLVFYPARAMIFFHLYTGSLVRGTHGTRIRLLCSDHQEFEIFRLLLVVRQGKISNDVTKSTSHRKKYLYQRSLRRSTAGENIEGYDKDSFAQN